MITVYVLTLATDYEGESLMGVYVTREEAEAAGQAWLDSHDMTGLSDFEEFIVRPIEVGAAAVMQY